MAAPRPRTAYVEPRYVSAACSRSNATAARVEDGLVAFASGHLIALWPSAVRPFPRYKRLGSSGAHTSLPSPEHRFGRRAEDAAGAQGRRLGAQLCPGSWKERIPRFRRRNWFRPRVEATGRQCESPRACSGRHESARSTPLPPQWTTIAVLPAHTGSVSAVLGRLDESQGSAGGAPDLLVVSGGSDSIVRTWRVSESGDGGSEPCASSV